MFTGIVETTGTVTQIAREDSNIRLTITSSLTSELKIDQSVSHNGACLTVVKINGNEYDVVAIDETLKRTNLGGLITGDKVNLERCTKVGDRLDGHIVQGHVDTTAIVSSIKNQKGSWLILFTYDSDDITVQKGSVCVNGVSLTVVDSNDKSFSVAIIPYTYEHTNFKFFKTGDVVNVEFDIIGKYVSKIMQVNR